MLSIGCGTGHMEHDLYKCDPNIELFIHELSASAWQWIGNEIVDEIKFTGLLPDCVPEGMQFDLIYLAAVDYALNNKDLVGLLSSAKLALKKGDEKGRCLIISASFQHFPKKLTEKLLTGLRRIKEYFTVKLSQLGLGNKLQLWGWLRTQNDYQELFEKAGYTEIQDGFIEVGKQRFYWISGG